MKITPEDFAALEALVKPLDTEERREKYRTGQFIRSGMVNDLWKRYRWDLFYGSNPFKNWPHTEYSDAHIDTALRRIVPMIERKY